ncbi:MAG: hypothetical protein LBB09_03775 [Rickettsiales bacterium]|jgi:regulatory protein YycI of two-component signal transduction system YycFG|nr:hypothetical protein [Rickettsiales bacterium]
MRIVKFVFVLILMGLSFVLGIKFNEMKQNDNGGEVFTKDNTEIVKEETIGEIIMIPPAEGDNPSQIEVIPPAESIDIDVVDAVLLDAEINRIENNIGEQPMVPQDNAPAAQQIQEVADEQLQNANTLPETPGTF